MLITTRLFPTRPLGRWRAHKVLERDILVYRRNWSIIVSGFFEPVFYLLGIGFGLGTLVGDVGDIPYAAFVAPGLMATTAMNGALMESTFNLFFKLNYAKTFDAILSTPLGPSDVAVGEVGWSLTRGLLYAIGFLVVMVLLGLVLSPMAILAIPGALLVGLAAASVGMAATTCMRKWQDFDLVTVVTTPMFLFSGTFFPITVYPELAAHHRRAHAALPGRPPAAQLHDRRRRPDGPRRHRLPVGHGPHRRDHHVATAAHPAAEVGPRREPHPHASRGRTPMSRRSGPRCAAHSRREARPNRRYAASAVAHGRHEALRLPGSNPGSHQTPRMRTVPAARSMRGSMRPTSRSPKRIGST